MRTYRTQVKAGADLLLLVTLDIPYIPLGIPSYPVVRSAAAAPRAGALSPVLGVVVIHPG